MGAVGDQLDPSNSTVPVNIGASNATAVNMARAGVNVSILGLPYQAVASQTETVASATNTALSPAKLVHVITGTTTINTFTGGVEGQYAVLLFQGALTINNATDLTTANTIHINARASGSAPANFTTTGASANSPYIKAFLFTANMPGATAGQWWEDIA